MSQLSVLALTSILKLGSKSSALPFASLSASLFPSRGAHSTTVRKLILLMYDASSMSTADAENLVLINLFRRAPFPRLSVIVGTI